MPTLSEVDFLPNKLSADLIDAQGSYRVSQIRNVLGLRPADFASITERKVESVAKLCRAETVRPRNERTARALGELTQIITLLRAMDLEAEAQRWMHTPMPGFRGRTPIQVLAQGDGQELIDRLLANATGNLGS